MPLKSGHVNRSSVLLSLGKVFLQISMDDPTQKKELLNLREERQKGRVVPGDLLQILLQWQLSISHFCGNQEITSWIWASPVADLSSHCFSSWQHQGSVEEAILAQHQGFCSSLRIELCKLLLFVCLSIRTCNKWLELCGYRHWGYKAYVNPNFHLLFTFSSCCLRPKE